MSRTVESIVENHRVASERRARGQRIWDATIRIKQFLNQEPPDGMEKESSEHCVHIAHQICAALKAQTPKSWREDTNDNYSRDFEETLENLEQVTKKELDQDEKDLGIEPVETLNGWLNEIYEWGNRNRAWIE